MKKIFLLQTENPGLFYTSGKIYVVVACALIIFFGLIGYLIFLEKKITKK